MKPITAKQLARIAEFNDEQGFEPFILDLNRACKTFRINTLLRQAHFVSQALEESAEFNYFRDEGDDDYKGRGLLRIRGKDKYIKAAAWFAQDFENQPGLVGEMPWKILVGAWSFFDQKLYISADKDDFNAITLALSPQGNGWDRRRLYLERAKKVLSENF